MMLFTAAWISGIFPEYSGNVKETITINGVVTDSRIEADNKLFVPIAGENFDGHDFLLQAVENGAAAVLWDRSKQLPESLPDDFPVFYAKDTVTALQELASKYCKKVDPVVIGITGSNGKTTTKDLVAAVAKTAYRTHYTDGNFNNHIGLPLTILAMKPDTEVLVLEMGMSAYGEIDLLARLALPDHVIITNIGESHIEYLGSREGIAKAKLEILHGLKIGGSIIIDGDEPLLGHLHKEPNTIRCGFQPDNDLVIMEVEVKQEQTDFQVADQSYTVSLLGSHHAKNAAYALAAAGKLGIGPEKCRQAFRSLELTGMRFEMITGAKGESIINDAYNASPTSMKAAIEVVKQMDGFEQKVLVLGDVYELGEFAETMHRSVAEAITEPITALMTFGEDAAYITREVNEKQPEIPSRHFTSRQDLILALSPYLQENAVILFKASRDLQFESLIKEIIHT